MHRSIDLGAAQRLPTADSGVPHPPSLVPSRHWSIDLSIHLSTYAASICLSRCCARSSSPPSPTSRRSGATTRLAPAQPHPHPSPSPLTAHRSPPPFTHPHPHPIPPRLTPLQFASPPRLTPPHLVLPRPTSLLTLRSTATRRSCRRLPTHSRLRRAERSASSSGG